MILSVSSYRRRPGSTFFLRWIPAFAGMTMVFLVFVLPARAEPILADLSLRAIDINTTFQGTQILLFGARSDAGDVVVVVRGPEEDYIVRKKKRVMGMWMNRRKERFYNTPAFYAIASSKDLSDIDNQPMLARYGVGAEFMVPESMQGDADKKEFWNALVAHHRKSALYPVEVEPISFWGESLFRTMLTFPKNIPGGTYMAEIYLFRDGELAALQTTPLHVEKVGFEAWMYELAHRWPLFYGIASVLLAIMAGWMASHLFRKS